jgi:hypothetical protein
MSSSTPSTVSTRIVLGQAFQPVYISSFSPHSPCTYQVIAIRRAYAKHKELKEATAAAARLDKTQAKQQREADMQEVIAQWQATNNGKAHCDCYLGQHQDHTCVGGHLCRNCHAIVKSRSCKKAPCVSANRAAEAEHIAKLTADAEGERERAGSE